MEGTSDSRFDLNFAIHLLLDVAHETSLEQVFHKLVRRVMERPDLACVQAWLVDKGDICPTCSWRAACPDQTRCLHLAAGGGRSVSADAKDVPRFYDPNMRMPWGVGLVGKIAATGQQFILRDLLEQPGEAPEFEWLAREHVRSFSGTPVTFQGEVLGVTAVFARKEFTEEAAPWGRIFADHIGAAIANARAFEEIQRLKALLEQQNTYLREEVVEAKAFGDLIGQSGALRQILSQIELVAATEASVLILGETGTGKELVAREIHCRSPRRNGPLVRVNCASIPKDLFESEFFGHAKGAFTGAIKDRAGRFETAEGGTLFLDEIGEVPLELQGKLLRVLQEKCFERVGEDRTRRANVRIVAATNRDLKQSVAAGRFREDLFYRLHVFPIHVLPLRERKDDIPLLAQHFVELSVKELKCPTPRLTRAAVTRLQNYDWPGNVRELRNVIERAVILARGGALFFDLPGAALASRPTPAAPSAGAPPDGGYFTEAEMRRRERENLRAVLDAAGWKIKGPDGAAERLGVKPTTLLARIKKQRLQRPATRATPAKPTAPPAPAAGLLDWGIGGMVD
jgi:transcriptional regulator with GAF, ATPase, and Fis domain